MNLSLSGITYSGNGERFISSLHQPERICFHGNAAATPPPLVVDRRSRKGTPLLNASVTPYVFASLNSIPAVSRAVFVHAFEPRKDRVVIVGGGFAGLKLVRSLKRAAVSVTLVNRRNSHLFSGFIGSLMWLFIHWLYLDQRHNRLLVLLQWMRTYFTANISAPLITGPK